MNGIRRMCVTTRLETGVLLVGVRKPRGLIAGSSKLTKRKIETVERGCASWTRTNNCDNAVERLADLFTLILIEIVIPK